MTTASIAPASPIVTHVTGYCCVRLPVRNLGRSVGFYSNIVGYLPINPDNDVEVLMNPMRGSGPGLFLMRATENEFQHIHWRQWGRLHTVISELRDRQIDPS